MSDAKNANRNGVNEQSTHTHTRTRTHTRMHKHIQYTQREK